MLGGRRGPRHMLRPIGPSDGSLQTDAPLIVAVGESPVGRYSNRRFPVGAGEDKLRYPG
jgi:hypothetical protein